MKLLKWLKQEPAPSRVIYDRDYAVGTSHIILGVSMQVLEWRFDSRRMAFDVIFGRRDKEGNLQKEAYDFEPLLQLIQFSEPTNETP
jgi:hypothetical protein